MMTTVERVGVVEIDGEWFLMIKHEKGPCICGCGVMFENEPIHFKMPSKGEAERVYAEMITDHNSDKDKFMKANWSRLP